MSRASLVALLLVLAGCPASNGESDGGVPADLAVSSADDLAAGSGTSVDLAPAPNTGTINVISVSSATQGSAFNAGASFAMGAVPTTSPNCVYTFVGGCEAAVCTIQSADAGSTPATYSLVPAGTVTITGGTTPVSMMPTFNYYSLQNMTQALFTGGETLTLANSGAVAPASSQTLVAPAPATITTPTASTSYTITRADGFPLAWTGGGPGEVAIFIQTTVNTTQPGTKIGSVRCSFPVGDGHATVPAAALAALPAGNASFQLSVIHSGSTTVNDWRMNASAVTYPLTPGGDPFSGGQATVN